MQFYQTLAYTHFFGIYMQLYSLVEDTVKHYVAPPGKTTISTPTTSTVS